MNCVLTYVPWILLTKALVSCIHLDFELGLPFPFLGVLNTPSGATDLTGTHKIQMHVPTCPIVAPPHRS